MPDPSTPALQPYSPERELILTYAPASLRAGLRALLDFDDTLAAVLRGTSDLAIAQMRFTWWHNAISDLAAGPALAQPVLQALASEVSAKGVPTAALLQMIEGWEVLIQPDPLDDAALSCYAEQRSGGLATAYGALLGAAPTPGIQAAMAGWSLADAALHFANAVERERAEQLARVHLDRGLAARWPRPWRPLGAMALLVRFDLASDPQPATATQAVRRLGRLVWHRFTGR